MVKRFTLVETFLMEVKVKVGKLYIVYRNTCLGN